MDETDKLKAQVAMLQQDLAGKSNESAIAYAENEKLQTENEQLKKAVRRVILLLEGDNPPTSPFQLALLMETILAVVQR